jgi:hypothetical protein
MAGLDPAIHVSLPRFKKTWMPGTRPGMTSYQLKTHPAAMLPQM